MEVYLVGGAVRDELLGRPVRERDWVVVGATPEEMVEQGFRPVGRDFPVFLHPESGEEYALARTERKTARGYRGFRVHATPDVTLEQDLLRRDLTVNAMARDSAGQLIDPYNGRRDIEDRVLRHVSPAFVEDPVRVLRVARFSAMLTALGFTIAPDTRELMREMVASGELDALVPERVWQETRRSLETGRPDVFFSVLRDCGALACVFPELDRLFDAPAGLDGSTGPDAGALMLAAVREAARLTPLARIRFAALAHGVRRGASFQGSEPGDEAGAQVIADMSARLRIPNDYRDLAMLAARFHADCIRAAGLDAEGLLETLEGLDAFRRPERFGEFLVACEAILQADAGHSDHMGPAILDRARAAASSVRPAGELAGKDIGKRLRDDRLRALVGVAGASQPK
jgi:tRNA nucleotidyltransferase (CCA-adding enzyme)